MATINIKYASSTGITCTLASLAGNSGREATAVDNTSNLYLDAELQLQVKMGAAAPTGDCYVLLDASADGTNFSDPATGSDAGLTPARLDQLGAMQPGQVLPGTDLVFAGKISCVGKAAAAVVQWVLGSVAALFGGNLPNKWGFVLVNMTGQALDATEGNHGKHYVGITQTAA